MASNDAIGSQEPLPPPLPPPEPVAPARQLPVHRGKLSRIQDAVEGAVLGLREWIELKVELTRREIEETVEQKLEQAKWGALAGVTGLMAVVFLLVTIGCGFASLYGWLLGMSILPALSAGYCTLVLILLMIAAVFLRLMRRAAQTEIELNASNGQR